ncbi:MAG: SRPBCC family protein [Ferruginibacter sp.]
METTSKTVVTVESSIQATVEKVWEYWTKPEHITMWCNASEDWHSPRAENDLRVGGKFMTRMEARDGSMGFDFDGVYDAVRVHESIEYTLGDNRKVRITFKPQGDRTYVTEVFEAEDTNPVEMQQTGWQNIMNNFKKYVEEDSN